MASVIDQTADLFEEMPKHLPSIQIQDPLSHKSENQKGSHQLNRATAKSARNPLLDGARELIEAALDYYNNGRLEEAAGCSRKVLELELYPDLTLYPEYIMVALYNLGVVSGELRRYEESKKAFQQLVQLLEDLGDEAESTTLASAHQGVGAALLGLWSATGTEEPPIEFASEGELEFRRAVVLDPNSFGAWVGLGFALHILERLDEAEAASRKALEIEPDSQVAADRLRSVLEDKLEKRLFELGYLSRINKPIRDFTPYENRTPIKVEGKPLSEIIVEERH